MKFLQKLWVICLITGRWSWVVRISLFILVIRWGVWTVYAIPSASMEPTLHGDDAFWQKDRVVVNKLAYGPMVPFTKTRLFKTGSPKRLDIVVIINPMNPDGPPLIKRVAGMPGEHIQIGLDGLYVDREKFQLPDDLKDSVDWVYTVQPTESMIHLQILIYSKNVDYFAQLYDDIRENNDIVDIAMNEYRRIGDQIDHLDLERMTPEECTAEVEKLDVKIEGYYLARFMLFLKYTAAANTGVGKGEDKAIVPEGHYFLLGDNGNDSVDSRFLGWMSEDLILGRAFGIVTPFDRTKDLSGFSKTAWGRFWLFGFIGLVLAYEFVPYYIGHPYRLQFPNGEKGYTVQWVWLNHTRLGIRGFFQRGWWKFNTHLLVEGSLLAVRDIHSRKHQLVGRIQHVDEDNHTITIEELDTRTATQIAAKDVVGLLKPLWYPFGQNNLEIENTHE
jgi:signal peptidase I